MGYMALFTYVIEKDGKQLTEHMDARDRFAVFQHVHETGGKLVSITEHEDTVLHRMQTFIQQAATVGGYDIIIFARTLSAMLTAGLPLSRALGISIRQVTNPRLKAVISAVADDIKAGKPFYEALSRHSIFSPLFLAMVRAGEESGSLPNALMLIADQLERSYKLKKQIRGAMMYPMVVVIAMIGVAYLMLTQIMPTMMQTFAEQNITLPLTTRVLVAASAFLTEHTVLFVLSVVLVGTACVAVARTAQGKKMIHYTLLYMPVVGGMVVEVNAARAGRTLASLVSSGVDMVHALTITKDVMVNTAFKSVIAHAEEVVIKGQPLSSTFTEATTPFPPLFGEMIAVGEETGNMAEMLSKLAVYYENELEQKMKNITSILEPVLMLFIGGTVGFFALAIIAPIYTLSDSM